MKVKDILRVKGSTLYTVSPDEPLAKAMATMAWMNKVASRGSQLFMVCILTAEVRRIRLEGHLGDFVSLTSWGVKLAAVLNFWNDEDGFAQSTQLALCDQKNGPYKKGPRRKGSAHFGGHSLDCHL